MHTFLMLLGVAVQAAGFVALCRVGAGLSDRLYNRNKWLTVAVAAPIMVVLLFSALVVQPQLTFLVQTAYFFMVAFAGGILARALQRIKSE
jgi:hypothetical protein